jgi:type II secretory pathway predicted ATPase ExeA
MYLQYFGFSREPFSTNLEPEKLYKSKTLLEVQQRFEHMCNHRGLMLFTGPPGCGKTTALRCLVETMNRKTHFPVYLPLSTVSVFEFYRQINDALGGERRYYKSEVYSSIQSQVMSMVETRGILPVVILDEAHMLRMQNFRELQIILNFHMDSMIPMVLILAGQPVLQKKMQSPELDSFNQRIHLKYSLESLSEVDTASFIDSSFSQCGVTEKFLTASAYSVIYQKSRGLPRLIGSLAIKTLMYGAQNEKRRIDGDDVLVASKEVFG